MKTQLTFYALLISFLTFAQVGVNTDTPSQALDVNGRIQVGEDGSSTEEEGIIRYNSTAQDLEGFANGQWQSLTSHSIGKNVEYVQLYHFGLPQNGQWVAPNQVQKYNSSNGIGTTVGNLPVPSGKILVIDQICVTAEGTGPSNEFYAGIREATSDNNGVNPQIYITGSSINGNKCLNANKAPLLVISAGNTLQVVNTTSSVAGFEVRFFITGFYVNNLLEYFEL